MQHELGNFRMIIIVTNRIPFMTFPLQLPGERGCHSLEGDQLATEVHGGRSSVRGLG